jgi:hypothetical protein
MFIGTKLLENVVNVSYLACLLWAQSNSPYKLCFGPKSFLVISDPVQARHILRDANSNYDKGVLAEILEPIMVRRILDMSSS